VIPLSFLGELIGQILGEAAVDAVLPNRKPRPPFPEGEENASLGAVSLFAGFLSLVFSMLALCGAGNRAMYVDMGAAVVLGMAVLSFLGALLAYRCGRKAPRVTRRNLWMASVGKWLSLPAMLASACAIPICLVRVLL
jgi:hypothetical protein